MTTRVQPHRPLTYCSNLHDIEEVSALLSVAREFWPQLAQRLRDEELLPEHLFPLGLWLSQNCCADLLNRESQREALNTQLAFLGGHVLTLNGFPMGNFHAGNIKEQVYRPDWHEAERLRYTLDLARLVTRLPRQEDRITISTLPGSFRSFGRADLNLMANNLRRLARELGRIQEETGVTVVVALEPEPGCTFQTTSDITAFFRNHLFCGGDAEQVRHHIGVCFDTCHQAIQYEKPSTSLRSLRDAGIEVAKMQLSSALEVLQPAENPAALRELASFAEDRYLHQVMAQRADGSLEYFEDLPDYLVVAAERGDRSARIHFHVPIFLEALGPLRTTRDSLREALLWARDNLPRCHFEIETYSWHVMPERRGTATTPEALRDDIVAEYRWVFSQLKHPAT